ncbi:unnamed protein product [Heligmosomoides polygyrus]|uniref:phosphoribosylformylglycinamidine cyclo-ligase n=1 Tax=Heligmosomoides polygyrus TaxID=6339 RepID=A0A183F5Q0_HELPZ|nr:unnamed protein product [Heligmosomoides polygyrus]
MGDYSSIGYDVVGMCVNDVLCHCAAPIAFVDYYVSGRLDRKRARSVVASIAKACVESDCSLVGQVLLTGTRLYVRPVLPLLREGLVKGCAHITGGGITENAIRILNRDGPLAMEVDAASWKKPKMFNWLSAMGPVEPEMMLRTFNCGIGMVLVVAASHVDSVMQRLLDSGEFPICIGNIVRRQGSERNFLLFEMTVFCYYVNANTALI